MKVCIITNIPAPYRVDLYNYLIDNYREYEFKIIYSNRMEDDRGWELNEERIRNSIFLDAKSVMIKEKLDNKHIHFSTKVIKVINDFKPDIIVGGEYNPIVLMAYVWARLKKIKYISWSDGTLNSESDINILQKLARKIICKNSDALIASSTKTMEAQIKYGADKRKIFISYLTINIENYLFEKSKFSNKRLLFVGRLSKRKGVDKLLKAISVVNADCMLTVIGDGPYKEDLETLAKQLKIDDKVIFKGSLSGDSLLSEYRNSDIFIIPSYRDCFGLVISEAMCNSLPIIASRYVDGAYDLVEEGLNGYIIDPYNTYEFAKVIDKIICDKKNIEVMGCNSYNKIQKFNFNNVSKGIIKALEYSCSN